MYCTSKVFPATIGNREINAFNLYETGKWWLVQEQAEDLDSGKWKQRTAISSTSCLQKKKRFGKHLVEAAEELVLLPEDNF
jgi:hypothetical protein